MKKKQRNVQICQNHNFGVRCAHFQMNMLIPYHLIIFRSQILFEPSTDLAPVFQTSFLCLCVPFVYCSVSRTIDLCDLVLLCLQLFVLSSSSFFIFVWQDVCFAFIYANEIKCNVLKERQTTIFTHTPKPKSIQPNSNKANYFMAFTFTSLISNCSVIGNICVHFTAGIVANVYV